MNDFAKYDPFSVGFDGMWKRLNQFQDSLAKTASNYPPYNIRKVDENRYTIELAVAGFARTDLDVVLDKGVLKITGKVNHDDNDASYLYKGIAERAFTRTFNLADTVEVRNAEMINGMLRIWLESFIPDHKKPKKINIVEGENSPTPGFLAEQS
jgi:molecular chaperone IbpA